MIDHHGIVEAVERILSAIGETYRPGLKDTPERAARAWAELTQGIGTDPAEHLERSFPPETDGDQGLVIVRDIPFYSLCEHHLLPFHGTASVGYIPTDRIVGLSKIARCVDGYARRLQVQERLTEQVADALTSRLDPRGVVVVMHARHLCMEMRGIRSAGSVTTTSAVRGAFSEDASARAEAMALLDTNRMT